MPPTVVFKMTPSLFKSVLLNPLHLRCFSSSSLPSFKVPAIPTWKPFRADEIEIQLCRPENRKPKPDPSKLIFGKTFTDHMFEVEWDENGWSRPRIVPYHTLPIDPAAKVLHYAGELFEGLKAYRGVDDKIRMFRPDMNMRRMSKSAGRISFPEFDEHELIECCRRLISIDKDWVYPADTNTSLYMRPTMIGTEPTLGVSVSNSGLLYVILSPVGSYFQAGQEIKPVKLLADPNYVRAWPGGTGDRKLGSNYAPTVHVQKEAQAKGFNQVLWLYGEDHQLTEVGTMNIFCVIRGLGGILQVITPPLGDGLILPGVTRDSIINLISHFNGIEVVERKITMREVDSCIQNGTLIEMFGAGTAAVVSPIGQITFLDKDLMIPTGGPISSQVYKMLTDIQYGRTHSHPNWVVEV